MNKKRLLSVFLSNIGFLPILRWLDALKPSLKILAYHRIVDIDIASYLFDENLVDATVCDFDSQMRYLSKHYTVKPLSEAYSEFQEVGQANIVSVTFDDGFNDLYFNVFPILKKYNIRATIFITTALIDTKNTLWSEQLIYALKTSKGKTLDLSFMDVKQECLIDDSSIDFLISKILSYLKMIDNSKRVDAIADILKQLSVDEIQLERPESCMLTWDMVKEMAEWGVEFGSHTETHPVLANTPDFLVFKELNESKRKIEEMLKKTCNTLAYPVGGRSAFNDNVICIAQSLDYQIACTYLSGINYKHSLNNFELKRLHVDQTVDLAWFKALITKPSLCAADIYRGSK
jgi:peptidoglycan/xylan/chitin deacetylase (PgdA/CDA1 family)